MARGCAFPPCSVKLCLDCSRGRRPRLLLHVFAPNHRSLSQPLHVPAAPITANTAPCVAPFRLFSFSSTAYHLPMIGPTFGTMTTGGSPESQRIIQILSALNCRCF